VPLKKSDFHTLTRDFLAINFSRSQPVCILHGVCMCIFYFFFGNTCHYLVLKIRDVESSRTLYWDRRHDSSQQTQSYIGTKYFGKRAELQKISQAFRFWNAVTNSTLMLLDENTNSEYKIVLLTIHSDWCCSRQLQRVVSLTWIGVVVSLTWIGVSSVKWSKEDGQSSSFF
jgi:hypothetical protein